VTVKVLGILFALSILFGALYAILLGSNKLTEAEYRCAEQGGVQVKTYTGFVCIKVEKVK